MTARAEKDNVLGDYAAFLRALLPQAQGFLCHDQVGKLFWSELPGNAPELNDAYHGILAAVLSGQDLADDGARLSLAGTTIYVVKLTGDRERLLGALTVLVDGTAAGMPYQFVVEVLGPALRSLQRELALRFRLLDGSRKLNVQAAEERLLHNVEKTVHQQLTSDSALKQILTLCEKYLQVSGVMLIIPDKNIRLIRGDIWSAQEADMLCSSLLEQARDPNFDSDMAIGDGDLLWLPVHQHGRSIEGVFALSGWRQQQEFSARRRVRAARYVVSHIEAAVGRDYDALTGLLAWPVFERDLVTACAEDSVGSHSIMCLDIDQLHVVNDTLGREAGDEILSRFAALLRETLPDHPTTRITSDSFAALLRNVSTDKARQIGETICARVRENVYVRGDQTYRPSVSIGVAPLAEGTASGSDAMATAQVACQAAKDRGRARVEVYESADVSIVRRFDDIQLVGYVRNAIENGRMALMGQRILPLKPGRVENYYEVLVRIVDDAGQHIPPADFLSAAERYQLMEELDRWVVANTLQLLSTQGSALRPSAARFAINLSGQSLGSDSFLPYVEGQIQLSGVPPELITFEITESVAVAKMQQAQAFMHALQKVGCHFSLDDFGTGLSSFAYLKLFPVDTLKIDGSFIRDIATNVVSQSVVAAIAEVARVMQLETVAEYVQDQAAMDLLRTLNITYAQGYLVGSTELLSEKLDIIALACNTGDQVLAQSSA